MALDKSPRLSVDITEEQKLELARLIPWGDGRRLWHAIIDDIIELAHAHGPIFVGLIVSGTVKPREVMPTIALADEDARKVRGRDGDD